jgi:hypothetical protein
VPDPNLDTSRLEAESARVETSIERELGEEATLEKTRAAEQAATAGPRKEAEAAAADLARTANQPLPPSEAAGMVFAPHEIDHKELQGFSWGLLGLALLGGAVSHGNWLGVSASLNGAMQGFIDGDKMRSDREWDNFNKKFNVARDHDQEALNRLEKVMGNKQMSLNAKMQEYQLIAAEFDMKDVAAAAQIKSHDAVIKQYEARRTALENTIARKQALQATLDGAMARKKAPSGPQFELTPEASEVANTIMNLTGGKSDLIKPLNSRFSSAMARPQFNQMVADIMGKHPEFTPEQVGTELVQNAIKYQGDLSAYRQGLTRSMGVARLALAVQGMQKKVLAAADKYGVSDAKWANKSLNALRNQLGDADYVKFRNEIVATARQYIEAVTMPGSNAQLHASSQETADKMISDDMTLDQIKGAFSAMNEEIESTGDALQTINERLLDSLGKSNLKTLFSYKDDAAAKAADVKSYVHPSGATVVLEGAQ